MRNIQGHLSARVGIFGMVLIVGLVAARGLAQGDEPAGISPEADQLHRDSLVFDAHNNLIVSLLQRKDVDLDSIDLTRFQQGLHTDLPRLRQGGVGAQLFATFVSSDSVKKGTAVRETLEQIENIKLLLSRYPQAWEMAVSSQDIERLREEHKLAGLIAVGNGASIDGSLTVLRTYYDAGVRCLALTHDDTHGWADAALDKAKHGGLSKFGEQVVAELNQLGIVMDLSHASDETIRDTLSISRGPVIFSHSGARQVANHPRNLADETLRLVAKNGGVVQVNFFAGYLTPASVAAYEKRSKAAQDLRKSFKNDQHYQLALKQWLVEHPLPVTTVADVVAHIDHIVKVAGVDHVGLGSNFDGVVSVPRDLSDVSCFPQLTHELLKRGYSQDDVRKILGLNTLRVLRDVERLGAGPRQVSRRTPATAASTQDQ